MTTGLEVRDLTMTFSGVDALAQVSFSIGEGVWLGLIGPNGSGKSTMLNVLSGLYRPRAGSVVMNGHDLQAVRARHRIRQGLSRTFQHPQLAASLTILENVMVGAAHRPTAEAPSPPASDSGAEWLRRLGCDEYAEHLPSEAPYGVQKLAEVARALMSAPSLLLLDEPAAGLSARERVDLVAALKEIRRHRPTLTLCLVEHDVGLVASLCSELAVLSAGRLIANGPTQTVLADEAVKVAYLGTRSTHDATP
ncbi:ABC transporter ATP-binding protein [Nakamurella leprariae]|uniref:ABC transporter ATP-binding protein n=1 Tax=Nakamurella leprariae TaxID=2803911 RepID=A0A938Y9U0_9ACTN|nr:ATP-binding cassette domain-containing protein [Nakamurella leprariae]MBM9465703.1 ABC transporter ATP-binding protein [Nakamurella leprariae]